MHTPEATTIDSLAEFLGVSADKLIKTLVMMAGGEPLLALLRGDHDLNEAKLAHAAGVEALEMADAETIEKLTAATVGFAGPVGLSGVRIIADKAVPGMSNAVTGANKTDYHLTGVNPARDFECSEVADIRLAQKGDKCANCDEALQFSQGIEIGHIFQLGTKYSEFFGARVDDEKGQSVPLIMGCYGIGLNRIMAAAIENGADENGIIWPISIAPFHIVITQLSDSEQLTSTAQQLYDDLQAQGCEVLWDDRQARPGVKFKDADLIGIPLRITVGEKALAQGKVEFKRRTEKQAQLLEPAAAVKAVLEITR